MMFVGIAIALCSVLVLVEVGFRKDENDVKSFEKTKNSDNIQTNENVIESKEEVYKVDHTTIFDDEDNEFMIISGYDKSGKVVWKYETEKIFLYTETQRIVPNEHIAMDFLYEDGKKVYVNDNHTIKALDFQTGEVVWECPNVQCLEDNVSHLDDDTKTLYLYSPITNIFSVIDKNGKLLKEIDVHDYVKAKRRGTYPL